MDNKKINKVFFVFKRGYKEIPLEVFKDPYKILISTLLSSRTRDETTLKSSKELFKKAPNIKKLYDLDIKDIRKLIRGVGFYNTKANHLKKLAKIVVLRFNGKIPQTRKDLMKLPGVGRKTANLTLNRAFGIPAIAVDTHVHRISNILGWVSTKSPQQTEKTLIKLLPRKYWTDINKLFVSIGRQFTTKKKLEKFLKEKGLI
jgi:endonuclease-3